MKKCISILLFSAVIFAVSSQHAVFADTNDTKGGSSFKLGIGAGALFYAGFGPKSVSAGFLKIKFDKDKFKVGGTGGLEGLFFPSPKHSVSLGAFYEQRRIDLKIVDISILGVISPTITIPFIGTIPFLSAYTLALPLDSLVKKTSLSMHYINIPLTYRFHFIKYLYFGLGLDVAVLIKAEADVDAVVMTIPFDLKGYLQPVDFGGRVLFGFTVKGVYGEFSVGSGILDLDKFNGTRRSLYLKAMVGYRFF